MRACPRCMEPLFRKATPYGEVDLCRKCGGRAVSASVLEKTACGDFIRRLRGRPARSSSERARSCPICVQEMVKVDFTPPSGQPVMIDVCKYCRLVWFDAGEYEAVVTDTARQEFRRAEPPGPGDEGDAFGLASAIDSPHTLPAFLGLPVELGSNRLRSKPLVTWGLTALMAVVFLATELTGRLDDAIVGWGMIPSLWTRYGGLTLVTSFFLHAGWWHLIGNAYFFLIFGDNVEDHLGPLRFVLLLVGAELAGSLLYSAMTPYPDIPCIGASAGISGVLAYYAIVFPRAKIGVLGLCLLLSVPCVWWWMRRLLCRLVRMPASVGLLLYLLTQVVGLYEVSSGSGGGMAYAAHLGGLAVGAMAGAITVARAERRKK